jgi:hypothetical protein
MARGICSQKLAFAVIAFCRVVEDFG